MKAKYRYIALVVLLGCSTTAYSQVGNCTSPVGEAFLDVNNVRARITNNGNLFWRGTPYVYTIPKDGDAQAIFTSGIWLGGLVGGDLRTAAARYGDYEYWSGPLDETGTPPPDCSVYDRVWKIDKRDVTHFEESGVAAIDLLEWPTGLGAPTLSADGTSLDLMDQPLSQRVNRLIDLAAGERPDFTGDQMLWWIMNDRGNIHNETETDPIGIEVHATAFAFGNNEPPGADATFYRYRIFNRNQSPVEDTYFGLFLDPDLGNFDDDYVGSDSTLDLGIVYNSDNDDEGDGGYGASPPALGASFVRGAVVPMAGDSAIVRGRWEKGFTDRGLTSFVVYENGGGINEDPMIGRDYYFYMQARWKDGRRVLYGGDGFESGVTRKPTNFMYSGDPVTRDYWSEFSSEYDNPRAPADRRFVASTGPFTMNAGDEQEIIVALPWARGEDNLDSVTELRTATRVMQQLSDRNFDRSGEIISPPDVTATPRDRSIHLQWTNKIESNNYADSYSRHFPFALDAYVFQGYRVYRFDSASDTVGRVLATYDIVDGVTKIIEGPRDELTALTADGSDSGLRHDHFVGGLTNYRTYYFGVQPYATKNDFYPRVLDGAISRVEVVPTGTGEIGIVPNPYRAASDYETSRSATEVRFTNVPTGSKVTIFAISGTRVRVLNHDSDGVLTWDLRNDAGRTVGSGMYVVHVDVPGIGSRILKFGVMQGAVVN